MQAEDGQLRGMSKGKIGAMVSEREQTDVYEAETVVSMISRREQRESCCYNTTGTPNTNKHRIIAKLACAQENN